MKRLSLLRNVLIGSAVAAAGAVAATTTMAGNAPPATDTPRPGIAAQFPGDVGIDQHPAVLLVETFESASLDDVIDRWDWSRGADAGMLALDDEVDRPANSPGRQALRMTVGRDGPSSADLRKILDHRHDRIHLRFYVRFAEDYGFMHHFTRIAGDAQPTTWMRGGAGSRPTSRFSAAIETMPASPNHYPRRVHTTPPGFWFFYTYWPGMRSWQTPAGEPDGRPNAYYGNNLMPAEPVAAKRGAWQCIEIMVRMNSQPGVKDGALALWVEGELVGHWDPQMNEPAQGYWMRDTFRWVPDEEQARDFPGFAWLTTDDPAELASYRHIVQLHHYVSDRTWRRTQRYAEEHPDFPINLEAATVWKDHVVVATDYIGPMGE